MKTLLTQRMVVGFVHRALLLLVFSSVLALSPMMVWGQHEKITNDLVTLYTNNPEIKTYLEESLAAAKAINPDTKTNPAQDLDAYLDFVDQASRLAPREILQNPPDLIRDQILQSICYFYFLVDQPIPELSDLELFKNALQYYPPFSEWLREFADTWGNYLDTTASWSNEQYKEFLSDPNFRLGTGDYEDPSNWNNFNRFFSRYLASPTKRPIASPTDDSVVVSPADSVPQGTWPIGNDGTIQVSGGLSVKNTRYFNVNDLLGPISAIDYNKAFNGGILTHTFLNVFDYHRYHFAVAGTVQLDPEVVQQNVALEVTWDSSENRYTPVDSTGWQFTQTRGVVILETDSYGTVALIPMGMAHVSSVNFEDNVKAGAYINKGEMLGTFLFGGSDFIMLFSKDANFKITAPLQEPGVQHSRTSSDLNQYSHQFSEFKHMLMGEEYGRFGK